MKQPVLIKEAKRVLIYSYGTDGEITVSKHLNVEEEMDYLDLLESGDIQIKNASDSTPIDLCGYSVDPDALKALDLIWG